MEETVITTVEPPFYALRLIRIIIEIFSKIVAVAEKPGFCPKLKPGQAGICVLACLADNDCSGAEKCCHTGCGYACMKPLGMSINMVSPYLGILRLLQVYAILLSAYSRQLFGPEEI